jgi:hypothetical protein
MTVLNCEQQHRAIELLHEYLKAPPDSEGLTPRQRMEHLDRERVSLIDGTLRPLVATYLSGETPLYEFKTKVDGINKRNEYWGFKGVKGQMFFNMVVNAAESEDECDAELKAAVVEPASDEMAKSRIRTFANYVKRLGDRVVQAGGSNHARPKVGSVPFFLSYFWQLQNRAVWPVYYTNSVKTMVDANLWTPQDDLADDYIDYKLLNRELAELFSRDAGIPFSLYDVEHVFWVKGGNPYGKSTPTSRLAAEVSSAEIGQTAIDRTVPFIQPSVIDRVPESYVPPIVGIIPRLAIGDEEIEKAATASGTTIPRALEKSVHAAFTILGYETKLLGQGAGRAPDGSAMDFDNSYAVIWDAKSRAAGYNMGTDDRAIREYVSVQSRELKRRRMLRNIYYVIVSSHFNDEAEDTIRMMKMETDVSEVCLMEASALVAMVEAKLRDPLTITSGPDGLQRLFGDSGVLTADDVTQLLG